MARRLFFCTDNILLTSQITAKFVGSTAEAVTLWITIRAKITALAFEGITRLSISAAFIIADIEALLADAVFTIIRCSAGLGTVVLRVIRAWCIGGFADAFFTVVGGLTGLFTFGLFVVWLGVLPITWLIVIRVNADTILTDLIACALAWRVAITTSFGIAIVAAT